MLPIKLTLAGLYSYQTKQVIDFEKLTSNQLFGIFGAVGSGKSAILEAMMFAVYGDTERLNNNKRNYNMMNLQSDHMLIDFECWTGEESKERYRFIREAKRNSKNFEDVKVKDRRVLKWVGSEWKGVDQPDVAQIIGMNYKHFKQTIIIPQGKFRAFIEQTSTERTKMLQELFQLERFDLADKVKELYIESNGAVQVLTGELSMLEEFSEEKGLELQTLAKEQHDLKLKAEHELNVGLGLLKKYEELEALMEELRKLNAKLDGFSSQEKAFLDREKALSAFRNAKSEFQEKLNQLQRLQSDFESKKRTEQEQVEELKLQQQQFEEAGKELELAQQEYEKKEVFQAQCNELTQIIRLKSLTVALHDAKEALVKQKASVGVLKEKMKLTSDKLSVLEDEHVQAQKHLVDVVQLKDWESKFLKYDEKKLLVAKEDEQLKILLKRQKNRIEELQNKVANVQDFTEAVSFIENEQAKVQGKVDQAEQQLADLRVKDAFAIHAEALEEGEACPLCGSEHHPHKLPSGEFRNASLQKESQIHALKEQLSKLNSQMVWLTGQSVYDENDRTSSKEKEILLNGLSDELGVLKVACEEIPSTFEVVQKQLAEWDQSQQKLKKQVEEIEHLRSVLKELQGELDVSRDQEQQLATQEVSLMTQVSEIRQYITVFKEEQVVSLLSRDTSILEDNIAKGQKKIELLSERLQTAQLGKTQASEKLIELQTSHTGLLKNLEELEYQRVSVQSDLEGVLASSSFTSLDQVRKVLSANMDIEQEEQAIAAFKQAFIVAQTQQESLQKRVGEEQLPTKEEMENMRLEVTVAEQKNNDIAQKLGELRSAIVKNRDKLEVKVAKEKELRKLENRLSDLKVLSGLFREKGFVKYVSSVYLQNLIATANERFTRMTQNKLSLMLDEKQEFIVQDALNGGKTRLLKTLSGGQMFQAALCLALALAEHVKSLNQSEQSFFFLDEGFGTLDPNSLKIVFETLKDLKKENRVVGVISHVEELQQEIEVSLHISNNDEQGSVIQYSWES